jgi:serine/threonine-protein kinase
VNQPPPEDPREVGPSRHGVYKDGPITGELAETMKRAPIGTKLTGHLWTSGERIFGRYLWAHVPGKGKIPICLELGDTGEVGIDKQEGSKPGAVIARRLVNAYPTREWR